MKILIIRFSSLGDIVLTTPIPRLLKKKFPNSEIHFITKTSYFDVYINNENIDKLIEFNDNLLEITKKLKKENYDFIIDLHNNIRSRIIKFSLNKKAITYKKQFLKRWIYTNLKLYFKINHIVDSYIDTLSHFGIENDGLGLDFYLSQRSLNKIGKSIFENKKMTALVVGAKHYTKILPLNKLIELCDKINGPIALIGGKSEKKIGKELENFFNHSTNDEIILKLNQRTKIFNFCGILSIEESAALMKYCDKVYTHDTGFMHIAAALKKEVISIYGSTNPDMGFYPYGTKFSVIENKKISCRPCTKIGYSKCPINHFKCLKEINFDNL